MKDEILKLNNELSRKKLFWGKASKKTRKRLHCYNIILTLLFIIGLLCLSCGPFFIKWDSNLKTIGLLITYFLAISIPCSAGMCFFRDKRSLLQRNTIEVHYSEFTNDEIYNSKKRVRIDAIFKIINLIQLQKFQSFCTQQSIPYNTRGFLFLDQYLNKINPSKKNQSPITKNIIWTCIGSLIGTIVSYAFNLFLENEIPFGVGFIIITYILIVIISACAYLEFCFKDIISRCNKYYRFSQILNQAISESSYSSLRRRNK